MFVKHEKDEKAKQGSHPQHIFYLILFYQILFYSLFYLIYLSYLSLCCLILSYLIISYALLLSYSYRVQPLTIVFKTFRSLFQWEKLFAAHQHHHYYPSNWKWNSCHILDWSPVTRGWKLFILNDVSHKFAPLSVFCLKASSFQNFWLTTVI
jgi:hypothetical protein